MAIHNTEISANLKDKNFDDVLAMCIAQFSAILTSGFFYDLKIDCSACDENYSCLYLISGSGYVPDDPDKRQQGAEQFLLLDENILSQISATYYREGRRTVKSATCSIRILNWTKDIKDRQFKAPGKQYDLKFSFLKERT